MIGLFIEVSALVQALAFTILVLLINERIATLNKNNVHVAYLRRLQQAMTIRARRLAIVNKLDAEQDPAQLERLHNKHLACLRWEKIHGSV